MQAEVSRDYVAALQPLPGGVSLVAAAADGRLTLLDSRGSTPIISQVRRLSYTITPANCTSLSRKSKCNNMAATCLLPTVSLPPLLMETDPDLLYQWFLTGKCTVFTGYSVCAFYMLKHVCSAIVASMIQHETETFESVCLPNLWLWPVCRHM